MGRCDTSEIAKILSENNVAGCRINYHKPIAFLHNKHTGKEITDTLPLTRALKDKILAIT